MRKPDARLALLSGLIVAVAGVLLGLAALDRDTASGGSAGEAFERAQLDISIQEPTSLAFGPDGRLYVATLSAIWAIELDPETHEVLATEEIASDLELVLGVAFDPTAPAPLAVYASRQDPDGPAGFQGVISRFTAPDWTRQDVITGLPTSAPFLNHYTNGIAFDDEGRLFIAQGSASDTGLPGEPDAPDYWPETPLSAAILVADIQDPAFDGAITYDPPGPPEDHNVDQVSGDVHVFSPGHRNPYDLVLHSNGRVYATDNGATGAATSLSCSESGGDTSLFDELNLVETGNYYGFPNRNRGRFDERQCTYRAPEDGSGAGFTGPIAVLPAHCSCNGIVEYDGPEAGEVRSGDLLYVEWARGRLSRARLSEDGTDVASTALLETLLGQPLDVTVGPDGTIYIAAFGINRIWYLEPGGAPATATPTELPTDFETITPTPETPTATPTATETSAPAVGDANCDGVIDPVDATLVLQRTAGLISQLPCPQGGDANQDGAIDARDATLILQVIAGLLDGLPPG